MSHNNDGLVHFSDITCPLCEWVLIGFFMFIGLVVIVVFFIGLWAVNHL